MSGIDNFTSYHEELLEGHYDCVDRIVVNAYFEYAQSAGGFRSWWRALMGSDETLDRAHLERMAGRFKRRLEAYAKKKQDSISVVRGWRTETRKGRALCT